MWFLLTVIALSQPAEPPIRVATTEWPPYTSKSLPNHGIAGQFLESLALDAGLTIEWHFLPWQRAITESRQGDFDLLFPAYGNDERHEHYIFSEPFAVSPISFWSRTGQLTQHTEDCALKPYDIGVVLGYENGDVLREPGWKLFAARTDRQNLNKLLSGRIDLAVIDDVTAVHLLGEQRDQAQKICPADRLPLYILVPKRSPRSVEVALKLEQALENQRQSGALMEWQTKNGVKAPQ